MIYRTRAPAGVIESPPAISKAMSWWTSLVFATSYFVEIEPAPFDILFLLYLGMALYASGLTVRKPLGAAFMWVAAFAMVRGSSMLFAADLVGSLRFFGITTYLSFSAFLFALLVVRRGEAVLNAMFHGLYAGAVITALAVLLGFAGVGPIADVVLAYGGSRAEGFFKDPNVMGPALIPVALFALGRLLDRFHVWHAGMLGVACLLIALSYSRGAYLTLAIALAAFGAIKVRLHGRAALRRLATYVITAAMTMGGAFAVIMGSDLDYVLQASQRSTDYDSDRFYVHERLLEEIRTHPGGMGPGEANNFVQSYLAVEGSNAAHNTYLRVAFENGWFGLVVFLALAAFTLMVGVRMIRRREHTTYAPVALCTFLATLVSGLAVDTLHWRHGWWMAGILWGLAAFRRQGNLQFRQHPMGA